MRSSGVTTSSPFTIDTESSVSARRAKRAKEPKRPPVRQRSHCTAMNESSTGRPLVIAHRGASALAPENTLAAVNLALALGADGVEFDVQLASDGRPVVIHDLRLDRTTSGAGPVTALPSVELSNLDAGSWFDRR